MIRTIKLLQQFERIYSITFIQLNLFDLFQISLKMI